MAPIGRATSIWNSFGVSTFALWSQSRAAPNAVNAEAAAVANEMPEQTNAASAIVIVLPCCETLGDETELTGSYKSLYSYS
jgi:hypothetical protein